MKIVFLLFTLMLPFGFCFAQKTKKENLWNGTGKFILGSAKSFFGADLKLLPQGGGGDTTKYVREIYGYEYLPVKLNGYDFGGVNFKQVTLTFQNDKVLNNFVLHNTYLKKDTSIYLKQAEDDLVKIAFYLKSKLRQRGVKGFSKNYTNSGGVSYDWKKKEFSISIHVIQSKIIGLESANIFLFFSKKE